MNCLDFLDRLTDLAAGRGAPAEREEAERHAAACSACADLLRDARLAAAARDKPGAQRFDAREWMNGEGEPSLEAGEADDLLAAVLEQTAGSACGRAEQLLCESMFPGLEDEHEEERKFDAQLVAAHLEHCAACSALAESLRVASAVLPAFREVDPGPSFTAAVFSATTRATPAPRPGLLVGWWRQWVARPRFAFELAYVATLLLVLIVGNPAATLQAASARTVSAAAAGIERARTAWPAAVPTLEVPQGIRALNEVAGEALARTPGLRDTMDGIWRQAARFWTSAWGWLSDATASLFTNVTTAWSRVTALVGQRTEPHGAGPR